jgi:DNA-binding winged helix-turn-helix (wHTH) protein
MTIAQELAADAPTGPVLRIDRIARQATVDGRELPLTSRVFDLLVYFLDRAGTAVSFDEIAADVWSYHYMGDRHFLHTAVYRLRQALSAAELPEIVEGIRGFGYRVHGMAAVDDASETLGPVRGVAVFDPLDPDLRLRMVNDAAVDLTGLSVEALTQLPEAQMRLWSTRERDVIDEMVREALDRGSATSCGRTLLRADGSALLVDVAMTRLDLPDGQVLCLAEFTPA